MTPQKNRQSENNSCGGSTSFTTTHYPHTRDHSPSFPGPSTYAKRQPLRGYQVPERPHEHSVDTYRMSFFSTIVHPGITGSFSYLAPRGTATTCSNNGFDRSYYTQRVSLFFEYITHHNRLSPVFSKRNSSLFPSLLILPDQSSFCVPIGCQRAILLIIPCDDGPIWMTDSRGITLSISEPGCVSRRACMYRVDRTVES